MQLTSGTLALAVLLAGSCLTPAMAQPRSETVHFPRGTSGTTIEGSITGDGSVRYSIGVSAGQTMDVQLDTDNASNYFNITAPGASDALYNGSISGNATSFVVPSSGNYVVDVYLMRNAARRGETANYDLTLYVESGQRAAPVVSQPANPSSNGTPAQLDMSQMPRFCVGKHLQSLEYALRRLPQMQRSRAAIAMCRKAISIVTAKPPSSTAGSPLMAASIL